MSGLPMSGTTRRFSHEHPGTTTVNAISAAVVEANQLCVEGDVPHAAVFEA